MITGTPEQQRATVAIQVPALLERARAAFIEARATLQQDIREVVAAHLHDVFGLYVPLDLLDTSMDRHVADVDIPGLGILRTVVLSGDDVTTYVISNGVQEAVTSLAALGAVAAASRTDVALAG